LFPSVTLEVRLRHKPVCDRSSQLDSVKTLSLIHFSAALAARLRHKKASETLALASCGL